MKIDLTLRFEADIKIVPFDVVEVQGTGWGVKNSGDGTTGFAKGFFDAMKILFEKGREAAIDFLLPTGLVDGQSVDTCRLCMSRLAEAHRPFAGADLCHSLYREENEKTFRFICDIFGIRSLDFWGDLFFHESKPEQFYTLGLSMSDEGECALCFNDMGYRRGKANHTLCFGYGSVFSPLK